MKTRQMTCARALMILTATDDRARENASEARLHASRCPHCSAACDPADPDIALPGAAARQLSEPAPTLRVALLTVSVAQLVLAIPWLVGKTLLPDSHVAVSHLTRDGALGLVIAGLGLLTVWRPRYAHSTKLIGLLVLGLQLVAGLADQQNRLVGDSFEVVHLLVAIIVLGLFAVAADQARRATPNAKPKSRVLKTVQSQKPRASGVASR